MKYNKVIAIMSLSILALLFSSFDAFDYDKAWKKVDQFIEKGLPKSALGEVNDIYDHAIKDNNIAQQIKAVNYKTQLILQTEELGLETVVSEIEKSIEKANMPGKQILHSMAGELMDQYFRSQYYTISQRTNLNAFETGDIRTWTPNNFRSYISSQYLASVDTNLKNYPTADFKDIVVNIKNADISLRPTLYELLLDRALTYFSNTNTQGTKPSFSFKINDPAYYSAVTEFVKFQIETKDEDSKLYQALLLFQEGLKLQLDNKNQKVLAEYDIKRLDFVNQHAEISKSNDLYVNALKSAADYYKVNLAHPFQIKIGLDLRNKKKYQEAINVFNTILNEKPSDYTKNVAERWINTINAKSLSIQTEQVLPRGGDFLVNVSSRNLNDVCFKLVDASNEDFSKLFMGKREEQRSKIEALPVLRRWNQKDIQDGYNISSFEEIVGGLPYGKYIIVASDTEAFKSDKSAYVFSAFFVSNIAHSTYDVLGGKKVSVRNRVTGKPLNNALVEVFSRTYNRSSRAYELNFLTSKKTDKDGFVLFDFDPNNSISYKIKYEDDLLDIEQFDYNNRLRKREYQSMRAEIFTDRAIYRPGQIAHFKTLSMKIDKEGVPSINPNRELTIVLNDANGQEVEKMTIKSNDYGSASGSFVLPTGRLTGQYSIYVRDGSYSNSHYFRVEEYKRPKFEVTIKDNENEIKLGDEINIEGNAKALSGAPVSNGKVSYVITRNTYYGWWSWYRRVPNQSTQITRGDINTGENGDFEFKFTAEADGDLDPSKNPTYSYAIQVDVTDLAGETRSANKSLSVAVFPYSYAWNLKEVMDISELSKINISPTTPEDKKVEASGTLIISELVQPENWMKPRVWQNPNNPKYGKDEFEKRIKRIAYTKSVMSEYPIKAEILRLDVEYGKEGLDYDFDKVLIAGRAYKIELISKEKYRGLNIKDTKYVAVSSFKQHSFPKVELLYVNGEKEAATVGKEHKIEVGTSDNELTAYYQIVRDWEIIREGIIDLENHNSISYVPTERDRGGYSIIVDFVKHNYSQRSKYDINLPWDNKKLNVELITKRDKVLPGSKEEWMLKISGPEKDKRAAEILATMYDASLDQFVSHTYSFNPYINHYGYIQGRFYGFNQAVNGNLNYSWSRIDYRGLPAHIIPVIRGLHLNGRYGINTMTGAGGERVMVRRSKKAIGYGVSSVADQAAPEAMMMEEATDSSPGSNSRDQDDSGANNKSEPKNASTEISIRKNLDESVFFYPHLKTDAEGNIILSFTMNEALTKWKLLTFAHDKDLRFGMTSHEVKTQKDVMIVPNAPRFLREGDRLIFPATITNLSEKSISADARLELTDPSTGVNLNDRFGLNKINKTVKVPVGESKRVDWEVQIPKNYKGLVKYRVIASAGKHSDGEENILPIVTNQTLVTETKVISLKKKEKKTFEFDAMAKTASATSIPFKYTLEYTSNPVWYAVQALPYLMEYPHNCTEQIFNRMYANTMASYIANQSPKIKAVFDQWKSLDSDALVSNLEKNESLKSAILEETPWVRQAKSETEQKKRIALLFDLNKMSSETKQVMEELKNRQMPSGAFAWFKGGREDVYITQNIVEGIAHLHHLGIISSDDYEYMNIIDKALVYLDEQSKKRYDKILENIKRYGGKLEDDHLSHISIHYLYIRSFFKNKQVGSGAQKAYDYFMNQAEPHWLGKGLYSEAMLGLTLKRAQNSAFNKILASQKERSFFSEELGRYWNIGSGFNWYELPIETHAMLIEFFTEAEKDEGYVEDMKIWLLKNKQTNHWKTTKGTAAAIYSLLIQGEDSGMIRWVEEDNLPVIQLSGKPLEIDRSNTEVGTGYFQKSWNGSEANVFSDLSEITIENKNETIAWGAAYYQYFEDLDKVKDFRDTPLKMKRQLFKEVKTDRDPELVEINDQTQLEPGDRIIARIEIKVDRSMSYVHLKDMRSSGFEPENVLSGYRWKGGLGYYESTRDLASHFFISHLNKGTYVFEYPMRVVHKGDFSTGIATIQCMYAPEFTSHSEGGRVEVR